MNRRALAAAGLGVVAACAVTGLASGLAGGADGQATPYHAALPPPPKPALNVPAPRALASAAPVAIWTSVRRPATARARPKRGARPLAWLSRRTPEGSANIVLVIGRAADSRGRVWVRARLPALPNGTTGWVPRSALGAYQTVRTRLVVDRDRLTATLLRDGRSVFRADIGVVGGSPSRARVRRSRPRTASASSSATTAATARPGPASASA